MVKAALRIGFSIAWVSMWGFMCYSGRWPWIAGLPLAAFVVPVLLADTPPNMEPWEPWHRESLEREKEDWEYENLLHDYKKGGE
jgi:hypothetical protein